VAKPSIKFADQTSVDVSHLLVRLGLILGFALTPVLLLVSQRAIFVLSSVALALILAAGPLLAGRMRLKETLAFLVTPVGIGCVFVSVWALSSLLWTPFAAEASPRLLKIVSTFLAVLPVAYVLPSRSRAANLYVLPFGVAAASLGAIVLGTGLSGARPDTAAMRTLADAMTVVSLLLWPAAMATVVRGRLKLVVGLTAVAIVASLSVHATNALIATAVAGLVFWLTRLDRMMIGLWLGRIVAASFVLAPLLPLALGSTIGTLPGLAWLKVWNGIISADGFRLLTGHGFNYVASGYAHGYLGPETPKSLLFEIWTDLGLLGAVSCAALALSAYEVAAKQAEKTAPYWLGALTFVVAMGVSGAATLQLWWITALALALVALIVSNRGDFQTERPTAPRQT